MSLTLYAQWIVAKAEEAAAIKHRRDLEDAIAHELALPPNLDKAATFDRDGYSVKVTGRISRKVDADKLQTLAAEHGLSQHLTSLFRWKPEINAGAWKAASPAITTPLLDAITSTAGRPSFEIAAKED
jgi:hypothetical protein